MENFLNLRQMFAFDSTSSGRKCARGEFFTAVSPHKVTALSTYWLKLVAVILYPSAYASDFAPSVMRKKEELWGRELRVLRNKNCSPCAYLHLRQTRGSLEELARESAREPKPQGRVLTVFVSFASGPSRSKQG